MSKLKNPIDWTADGSLYTVKIYIILWIKCNASIKFWSIDSKYIYKWQSGQNTQNTRRKKNNMMIIRFGEHYNLVYLLGYNLKMNEWLGE